MVCLGTGAGCYHLRTLIGWVVSCMRFSPIVYRLLFWKRSSFQSFLNISYVCFDNNNTKSNKNINFNIANNNWKIFKGLLTYNLFCVVQGRAEKSHLVWFARILILWNKSVDFFFYIKTLWIIIMPKTAKNQSFLNCWKTVIFILYMKRVWANQRDSQEVGEVT